MNTIIHTDLKDKRILQQLFKNGRMPYSTIAKNVQMSKQAVAYRIQRLLDKGLLIGFNTVIDVQKIGWEIYIIYLNLKNINKEKEEKLAKFLITHPNVAWTIKCIGNYDFVIKIFVKNYRDTNNFIKTIENQFEDLINDYKIDLIEKEHLVPLPFLYQPLNNNEEHNLKIEDKKISEISDLDLSILKEISHGARKPTIEIANKLKTKREIITYHLKKLEKDGIIKKYRPSAWSGSKSIGYSWYIVMLKLGKTNKEDKNSTLTFILNNPNMTYVYNAAGQHDILFEIRLKTGDELDEIMMNIRSMLKDSLQSHELVLILKEYKYTYFPDCINKPIILHKQS